ncbi:P2Y purinoceptor 3-like [Paramormyrops kingsleyae]|uniref:P2Y purinoceptor 3-like n=1 Tax=Paramormyrops kingsleyae TaxID=1676925 RepID=A0A3B3R0H3_9TELE|nr:P2Y purinoceptor 3-like [Paramormyrops kingsleyae]
MTTAIPAQRRGNLTSFSPCSIDESYKYIFLPICYSFTFVFSLSLNSVVLYHSFRRTRHWNASLIYMVNLASTDLMYGLSLPFLVASYVMRDHWVFGDFMCRLVRFLFYFNLYCSIFFLTCISVHRYLGICHPMRIVTMETKRAVKGTCILVWAVVFALTSPIFRFAQTGDLTRAAQNGHLAESKLRPGPVEVVLNCWDDAIDTEIPLYIPYGIVLHLLGFFVPFTVIAWCYSHVVLTIIRTLRMQPCLQGVVEERRADCTGRVRSGGVSLSLGPHSSYVRRRRKSVKTIITIILLFALCFFPFHVTRTIFFILKVTSGVECQTMRTVSICYKITRPLASFNAWLNALLYFLTKEKGAQCCPSPDPALHGLLWPLRAFGRGGEEEEGGGEVVDNKENESKSSGNTFRGLA